MYEESYGSGMTTSKGDKPKVEKGSPDARKPYMKDMYDLKPPMPSASKPLEKGATTGMSDKVGEAAAVDPDLGSKHYGKGNPYKKKAKAQFKSFQDLRDYADKMGK